MLPSHATRPWEVLEINLMCVGVSFLACNEYTLLAADKASKFPFTSPPPSKCVGGVARELLQLCKTSGLPKVIRCDGGKDFGATDIEHLCRCLKADVHV